MVPPGASGIDITGFSPPMHQLYDFGGIPDEKSIIEVSPIY